MALRNCRFTGFFYIIEVEGREPNQTSDVIRPVGVARDLGILLDKELSMKRHINSI